MPQKESTGILWEHTGVGYFSVSTAETTLLLNERDPWDFLRKSILLIKASLDWYLPYDMLKWGIII